MRKRSEARKRRQKQKKKQQLAITGVIAIVVVIVGALIWQSSRPITGIIPVDGSPPATSDGMALGPPNADVVIVEYSDFT